MAILERAAPYAEGIGSVLGGLGGSFVPALGSVGGASVGGQLGTLFRKKFTPQPAFERESREAQRELLGRLRQQQPFERVEFGPIRERAERRFREETMPRIAEQFNILAPGQEVGAQPQVLAGALGRLETELSALEAEHNERQQQAGLAHRGEERARLGDLGALLSGQQQYNLQKQGDTHQSFLQNLLAQQQAEASPLQSLLASGKVGLGQQFQTAYEPGSTGAVGQIAPELIKALVLLAGRKVFG